MKKIQFKRLNNLVSGYVKEGITSYGNMDINGETARRLGFKINKDSRNTYYIAFNNTTGEYRLGRRTDGYNTIVLFTNWSSYKNMKKDLVRILSKNI